MFLCLFSTLGLHQTAYVFLCFCVFFRKIQKHIDQMFLCLFLTLGLHQTAYVFLCFCVFSGKHKNTLTHFFFSSNNKIAPESQCVFVFLCFFLRKAQKHIDKMFLCLFFNIMIAPDSLCVFVFLCFFRKTQKHIDPILLKVDCGRKFAILSISVWPKKFKCRRNMKSCTFKQKPHQNCSQFLLQE